MRYFKQNYTTYLKLSSCLYKSGIRVKNRCTLCYLAASANPYTTDHNQVDRYAHLGKNGEGPMSSIVKNFSTNDKRTSETPQTNEKPEKKSIFKRFKEMYRDYWYVLIPVHLITSAVWVGGFYYLATSGVDIPCILETMNCSEKIVNSMKNSSMGYWAITYGLYKIATPARYAVTLGGTTVSIQYLKKWGYIRPSAELKEMYREKKQNIIDQKDNILDKVSDLKDKKDRFVEKVKETQKDIRDRKDNLFGKVSASDKDIKKKVNSTKNEKT